MSNDTTTVQTLPEAPVSATVKVLWRGYDVLYTTRGHTGGETLVALDKALTWFEDHGGKPTNGYIGTGAGGHAPAPAAAPVQTVADHGPMPGFEDCEWIVVNIPRDGKQKVEFWREDRKYAEESVTRKPEEIGKLLAPLGLDATPAEHKPFPVRVHYTIGRERPKREDGSHGGWYHDITRLEVLPPA